ncbi:uncharacterized protein LOC129288816 [Prosopis cineraria]|uniref:uncharacterized protein LOC129288816 n=1 Tax=Prosopis cineraria TaxID=364024 RepID=UPI00240F2EFA|nr:uncharacterized protein LOC129288816 [Prosopis cineraria]XP_054781553.1 uncharacterized protein LOC129288816 [Prosopis cineraria]
MEGKNRVGSSSSFTSELFGSKDPSPSSSSGILGSIFSPSSKVPGNDSLPSGVGVKTASETWSPKIGTADGNIRGNGAENQSSSNKDLSSIYQEQRVQPCHLSSSIYYGGQDIYSHPQNKEGAGPNPLCKKDGGEDDSGSASRGNWWQGSLYY